MLRAVRRNTELGLIVLGTLITVGAYVLASLAEDATIPADIWAFLGIVLGLQLAAHIAIRRFAPDADGMLLPIAGLLNGLGYVFIVRLDEARVEPKNLAGLQSGWVAVGIAAFIATLVIVRRVRDLERYRWTIGFLGLALLLLPLVPYIGREYFGARIWVSIGPVNFQPGEFAKILLAIFFASYLVEKRELLAVSSWRLGPVPLPDPKHLGPVLLAWGASLVIMISQKDLGSSMLFFALFVTLLWVATERATYLAVGLLLFAGARCSRTASSCTSRTASPSGSTPGRTASTTATRSARPSSPSPPGGLTGTGINLGSPKRIPLAETDFIFAAIGEELGLVGATAILFAYLLIVGAGLRIALRTEVPFERLLATGLTLLIGVQSFIIIAGVIRVLPLTGVTLPFVSYGGSSLIANYVLLALLLRISDDTNQRLDAQ